MVKDNSTEYTVPQAALSPEPSSGPTMEQVYREHASRVISAAYRVTGRNEDAEDVLQTVFMRLVRSNAHFRDNPAAYLHRAAVNASLDLIRSRKTRRASPLEESEHMLAASDHESAERTLASGELREEVRKALGNVSPRSAEIFALKYFEGYDNHEIARMLGSSRSTINVILHRARHQVREAIRPYVGEQA